MWNFPQMGVHILGKEPGTEIKQTHQLGSAIQQIRKLSFLICKMEISHFLFSTVVLQTKQESICQVAPNCPWIIREPLQTSVFPWLLSSHTGWLGVQENLPHPVKLISVQPGTSYLQHINLTLGAQQHSLNELFLLSRITSFRLKVNFINMERTFKNYFHKYGVTFSSITP